ncbi:4-hydroxythreonine-4-phosphate dehydrogenase PdxA [Planctomicrobium sp. SH661]|uniref:4-hydroxythreonine-4-phosphate dehydrogenase PdxA n=1 Tax=Planctomicrobium sp. SH661 TaxID=3448124 RepID=UPI003F5C55E3
MTQTSKDSSDMALEERPRTALTMGDVAGIGPEILARVLADTNVLKCCRPVVVGDPDVLERACELLKIRLPIREVQSVQEAWESESSSEIPCWNPGTAATADVAPGRIAPRAGQASYEWLVAATQAALRGDVDTIVTAPISKAALHAAGFHYPGHTEILAEQCGVNDFAMMLYLPHCSIVKGPAGLGVAHVTLHTSIASVPNLLTTEAIREKIFLMDSFLRRMGCAAPRIGVCALNPHAGEGGLFGDEESRLIAPAVAFARKESIAADGPAPADTLLQRAVHGAYDGVVAMYHDQGHIALKLIAFQKAVNVTLGLPIIRTSPSHGTGFDISWRGMADDGGMREAIRVATELFRRRKLAS